MRDPWRGGGRRRRVQQRRPRGSRPGHVLDYQPVRPEVRRRVDELAAACARHGVALPAAALRFPLRHKAVTSVVTGARTPAEIEANAAHLATEIPDPLWVELDELAATW